MLKAKRKVAKPKRNHSAFNIRLSHTLKKKGRAFRNIGTEKYISLTVKSALLLSFVSHKSYYSK